ILCAYAPSPTRPTCSGQPSGDLFPVSARPDNPALAAPERFPPNRESPCAAPKRHSISIRIGRVRRKRQRLPSSLLIENASARQRPAFPNHHLLGPRRFRSRLATIGPLVRGGPWGPLSLIG